MNNQNTKQDDKSKVNEELNEVKNTNSEQVVEENIKDKDVKERREFAQNIEKLEEEKALLKSQLIKALADYANLERDIDKRMGIVMLQNKLQIMKALLKTIDDVNFAFKSAESIAFNEETQNWLNGLKMVLSNLDKAFDELGIERIFVNKGDAFDSGIHEAVSTIPTANEDEDNKVFDVIQVGFKIGEAVIRPARVVISKLNK